MKNILVVEHDLIVANTLDLLLDALEVPHKVARDEEEALEHIKRNKVGIVFCDIPYTDFGGICKKLIDSVGDDIVVIVMTTTSKDSYPDDVVKKLTGADAVLRKPFDVEEIQNLIM